MPGRPKRGRTERQARRGRPLPARREHLASVANGFDSVEQQGPPLVNSRWHPKKNDVPSPVVPDERWPNAHSVALASSFDVLDVGDMTEFDATLERFDVLVFDRPERFELVRLNGSAAHELCVFAAACHATMLSRARQSVKPESL